MAAILREIGKIKEIIGTDAERVAFDTTGLAAHSIFIVIEAGVVGITYKWTGSAWVPSAGNSYEMDANNLPVQRIVDAAPFAYEETLDLAKTSQYCTNMDNLGSKHHLKSAATTNSTSVKASPGRVHMMNVSNLTGAAKFLKLYNLAVAPTVGTSTPFMVIPIQANSTLPIVHNDIGIYFSVGIAYAITGAVTDADTTAVGANEVLVNMIYK